MQLHYFLPTRKGSVGKDACEMCDVCACVYLSDVRPTRFREAAHYAVGVFSLLRTYGPRQVPLEEGKGCLLYTSPSPRDLSTSRMPSSA